MTTKIKYIFINGDVLEVEAEKNTGGGTVLQNRWTGVRVLYPGVPVKQG